MRTTNDDRPKKNQELNDGSYFEEDPIEAYKREFKRKRWEREKLQKERRLRNEQSTFRIMRITSMPILLFAVVLVADSLLPANVYSEIAEEGWQKRFGRRGMKTYVSYMRTKSFVMAVPHEIHLNYPYYDNKVPLTIEASPIFNIPERVTTKIGEQKYSGRVSDTVYYLVPFQYLLFLSALYTVWRKQYSKLNYYLSFVPLLILCLVILRMDLIG